MIENKIMEIIFTSLQSDKERIVLQALKLLTKLGDHKKVFLSLSG